MINYSLTREEAETVLRIIGQLPTSSNAHPLFTKMGQQYQGQLKVEKTEEEQKENNNE